MRKYLSLVLCVSILFGCARESDVENLQKQIDESGAVNPGLSDKWAKSNLSEDGLCPTPEDYGDYYA